MRVIGDQRKRERLNKLATQKDHFCSLVRHCPGHVFWIMMVQFSEACWLAAQVAALDEIGIKF